MKKNKYYIFRIILVHLFVLLFCSGCIAIPVGKERFTTEYLEEPENIEAKKTFEPFVFIKNDIANNNVKIGLSANVTIENRIEQKKKSVSVVKQKKIAFGLFPYMAEGYERPVPSKNSMAPLYGYKSYDSASDSYKGCPNYCGGEIHLLLGSVYGIFFSLFDSYECSHHYAIIERDIGSQTGKYFTEKIVIGEKTHLLEKFSKSDREKMRIWISSDQKEHPHNSYPFLRSLAHFALLGFFKFCTVEIEDPIVVETIQHPAEISKKEINVSGPYYVKLKIPGMDFQVIKQVNAGETSVSFDLPVGAEKSSQNGVVSFSKLKLDLMEEGDEKSILEKALEKEFPISLNLPVKNNTPQGALQANDDSTEQLSYKIDELTDDGNGIMIAKVSILTNDNFDGIDKAIRNELSKQYKTKYLNLFNGESKLYVKKRLLNSGKTIIYTLQVK